MEAARPRQDVRGWVIAALIAGIVALFCRGSLEGSFVFDDGPGIVSNPTLRHPAELGRLLFPPGDQAGTGGGRPLLNATLALNYAWSGTTPFGYHLVNLTLHVGSALLLFGIVRRTPHPTLRRWPDATAAAIALLWAVHPLTTQAVTYVIQRAESLMGFCFLLTLYCSIRGWLVAAVIACVCGMASKEPMAVAPLIVLLYDRTFVFGTFRAAWERRRGFYLCLAGTWLPLALFVASTHGRGDTAGFATSAGVWPYLLTQCRALAIYLARAIWPAPLIFDYGPALAHQLSAVWPQAMLVIALLGFTVWALRERPSLGFLGAWFFLILAPSSSFIPIATEPIAEHRMYLPLIAIVAYLAAIGAARLPGRVAAVAAAALVAALGFAAWARNADYRSAVALWTDTVRKMPGNPRAHNDLGTALDAAGQGPAAAREFAAALAADPSYLPAEYNLGVHLLNDRRPAEALPHLVRAQGVPRHQAELQLYLAQALIALHRFADAVEPLRRAVALSPHDPELRNDLGNALLVSGQASAAADEYRAALRLRPGDAAIEANLRMAEGR